MVVSTSCSASLEQEDEEAFVVVEAAANKLRRLTEQPIEVENIYSVHTRTYTLPRIIAKYWDVKFEVSNYFWSNADCTGEIFEGLTPDIIVTNVSCTSVNNGKPEEDS
ncbi:hypothetical protein L9F63_017887 [Diploptera punctata]|uniref:Uncharacterized protein n=1 Tax=Diploptera punctata TaxID=6984 RepID=A0AAD7ZY06_DIPPU|nr:hypothetical protein L9F63_017887 [Diploptera punctata]